MQVHNFAAISGDLQKATATGPSGSDSEPTILPGIEPEYDKFIIHSRLTRAGASTT